MVGSTRTLVVLRHAKSAWPDGVPDAERPLAPRGRRDAPAVGRWLREHVAPVHEVVCSPALRARQTWHRVARALDAAAVPVRDDPRMYPGSAQQLLAVVRDLPDSATVALLIGHNPGMEDLVHLLSGTPAVLRTSALAVLTVPGDWADTGHGGATLTALATPRGGAGRGGTAATA